MYRKEISKLVGSILETELKKYCKRKNLKYNLHNLAELIGIKRTTLSDILKGKSQSVDLFNVMLICYFIEKEGGLIINHPDIKAVFQAYAATLPKHDSTD